MRDGVGYSKLRVLALHSGRGAGRSFGGRRLFERGRLPQYDPFPEKCRLEHRAEKSTDAYIMTGYANVSQCLSRKMRLCIGCSLEHCVTSNFA